MIRKGLLLDAIDYYQTEAMKRYRIATESKQYESQSVALIQVDMLKASQLIATYSFMLDNRTNLQGESFMIEKIEFAIALLKNSQARIKAANRDE